MSDAHGEHRAPHGDVRSEEDRSATGTILWVGVVSLIIFFFASFAAVSYFRIRHGARPPLPIPAEIGASKIGLVEQQPFELAVRGERDHAARLERLRSFGWVDRREGIAHIPVEQAMDLVVQGVRPRGSPTQERPRAAPGGQP
jgi:hypothetical protein